MYCQHCPQCFPTGSVCAWCLNAVLGWMLRTIQVLLEMAQGCSQLSQHKIQTLNFPFCYGLLVADCHKVQIRWVVSVVVLVLCSEPVVARCSPWLSEFRCEVLKLVGRRFKLILCFSQESAVKKVLGHFSAQECSCSPCVPVFPCALLGCGTEVNNSVQKGNQTSLESWADVRGFSGLVMARPPCVLPLCFRSIVRINLETKESCCARPGVVCAALLKDSCAVVCRVLRISQPSPASLGSVGWAQLPAPSKIWVYFISFFLKAVLSHGISGPAFSQPQPATVA